MVIGMSSGLVSPPPSDSGGDERRYAARNRAFLSLVCVGGDCASSQEDDAQALQEKEVEGDMSSYLGDGGEMTPRVSLGMIKF